MELLEVIKCKALDEDSLKNLLIIERLPDLCNSIYTVVSHDNDNGIIYCVWGVHKVNREIIKHGVRFSLIDCPNALIWTVTVKEGKGESKINIHCTTDNEEKDEDFIDSIRAFVMGWKHGLMRNC